MERGQWDEPVDLRRARRFDPFLRRSPGGFRTVRLNLAGWATLTAAGLVAGGLSAVAGTPVEIALPGGVVAAWLVALVLDTLRWRNQPTRIGRDDLDETNGQQIVARLREVGVRANYEEDVYIEPDGTLLEQRYIRCRNADAKRVRAEMTEVLGS